MHKDNTIKAAYRRNVSSLKKKIRALENEFSVFVPEEAQRTAIRTLEEFQAVFERKLAKHMNVRLFASIMNHEASFQQKTKELKRAIKLIRTEKEKWENDTKHITDFDNDTASLDSEYLGCASMPNKNIQRIKSYLDKYTDNQDDKKLLKSVGFKDKYTQEHIKTVKSELSDLWTTISAQF